jgi:hypothetical protein
VPTRLRQPLVAPASLNGIWALDFMEDALYGGRRFRTFNVLDEGNREALAIEIGTSIPAARVLRVLEQLLLLYGRPQAFRLDNGPELTADVFTTWCEAHGIALLYIQPGKPDQNAFIERGEPPIACDLKEASVLRIDRRPTHRRLPRPVALHVVTRGAFMPVSDILRRCVTSGDRTARAVLMATSSSRADTTDQRLRVS